MKHIDFEWIITNWENATDEDKEAAREYARRVFRENPKYLPMTVREAIGVCVWCRQEKPMEYKSMNGYLVYLCDPCSEEVEEGTFGLPFGSPEADYLNLDEETAEFYDIAIKRSIEAWNMYHSIAECER